MEKWLDWDGHYIDGDVLRWKEAVWSKKHGNKKPEKLGERRVTAAFVTTDSKGFVRLSVLKDEIISNKYGMPLKTSRKDEVIVKKPTTVSKGSPERLMWSDETARSWATAQSRFFR